MKNLHANSPFSFLCQYYLYYFPTPAVLYLPLIRSGLPERKPNSNRRPKGNLEPLVEEDEGARRSEVQLAL